MLTQRGDERRGRSAPIACGCTRARSTRRTPCPTTRRGGSSPSKPRPTWRRVADDVRADVNLCVRASPAAMPRMVVVAAQHRSTNGAASPLGSPCFLNSPRVVLRVLLAAPSWRSRRRSSPRVHLGELLLGERTLELLLQFVERRRARRAADATRHDEPQRSVERWQLGLGEVPRDLLGNAQSRHADRFAFRRFFDVVVDLDVAVAHRHHRRQRGVALAHGRRHDRVGVDRHRACGGIR